MKADHRMRADSWRTPAPHGASSFSAQPRPSTPTDSQSQATPKAHPPTQGQTRQPNRSATSRARGLSGARLPELQLQVVDAGCRPHGLRRVRASSTTSRTKNVPPGTAAGPPGGPSALSPNGARREHREIAGGGGGPAQRTTAAQRATADTTCTARQEASIHPRPTPRAPAADAQRTPPARDRRTMSAPTAARRHRMRTPVPQRLQDRPETHPGSQNPPDISCQTGPNPPVCLAAIFPAFPFRVWPQGCVFFSLTLLRLNRRAIFACPPDVFYGGHCDSILKRRGPLTVARTVGDGSSP
jgi:hypothetical protein